MRYFFIFLLIVIIFFSFADVQKVFFHDLELEKVEISDKKGKKTMAEEELSNNKEKTKEKKEDRVLIIEFIFSILRLLGF